MLALLLGTAVRVFAILKLHAPRPVPGRRGRRGRRKLR